MNKYIGIIPARYGSTRFEGKPLCDIKGKPMIQWVYESAMKWDKWKAVYVATDSQKIHQACSELGIDCIMTSELHSDCLDRAAEVVKILESDGRGCEKYIVIQGDEPLFNVETLNVDLSPSIVNFYTESIDDMYEVNSVKVTLSQNQRALYYSRYSIPYHGNYTKRGNPKKIIYKQIGVYMFTGEMLRLYNALQPTYLENMEGIGLNRLIENDVDVFMRYTPHDSRSVDTPSDRDRIIEILEEQENG